MSAAGRLARTMAASILLFAAACGSNKHDERRASGANVKPPQPGQFDCSNGEIRIGMVKAQTGGFAFFDMSGAKGALIAVDILNKDGGIEGCPIRVTQGNMQSDPAMARQVAEELLRDGAELIITPGDFDMGVGASQAAQEAKRLSISFEASASAWSRAIAPYHFTTAITEDDQARAMAAYALQRRWTSTYLVTNGAFNVFTTTEAAFLRYYPGSIVGRDIVADDAADYAPTISKIRANQAQIGFIFLNDYFPHVGTFIRQLRAAGIDLPVLGNQNFSTPALPGTVGAAGLRNVFYVGQGFYEGAGASAAAKAFSVLYARKFGAPPENANSLAGFEGMLVLADALKRADTTQADRLAAAISAGTNQAGPTSFIYNWVERHPLRSSTVVGFDDKGRFIRVGQVDPRTVRPVNREGN